MFKVNKNLIIFATSILNMFSGVVLAARNPNPRGFVSNIERRQMQDLNISSRTILDAANNNANNETSAAPAAASSASSSSSSTQTPYEIPAARSTTPPPAASNQTPNNRYLNQAASQSSGSNKLLDRFKTNGASNTQQTQSNGQMNNNVTPYLIQYK